MIIIIHQHTKWHTHQCHSSWQLHDNSWKSPRMLSRFNNVLHCNPTDHSSPGFSGHGIFQARILEWVAMPFSRGSFQLRNWTWVSHMTSIFFIIWTTRETPEKSIQGLKRRVASVSGSDHNAILGKSWIFLPLFSNLVSLAPFGLRNWFAN